MQRERRTLSVPTISYEDVDQQQNRNLDVEMIPGFLGTPPQGVGSVGGGGAGWPPQHPGIAGNGQLATPAKSTHMARSRSASTSSVSTPTGPSAAQKKKIVTACQRCRTRKIRCDGVLPACKSCVKAGVDCIEVDRSGDNNMPRSHVLELENRIKWLEDIITSRCPDINLAAGPPVELRSRPAPPAIRIVTTGPDFNQPPQSMSSTSSPVFALSPASTCATPASFEFSSPGVSPGYLQPTSPFTFSDTGPSPTPSPGPSSPLLQPHQENLSSEVGLLSLSVSEEPKYVGPSSGVSFARLVFADSRDSDCNPSLYENGLRDVKPHVTAGPAQLPNKDECLMFSKTYFETAHIQYPFLHRPTFEACLEAVFYSNSKGALPIGGLPNGFSLATARFHVFLVLSIGANIVSTRSKHAMDSEGYYAAAMQEADHITLTGSLQGLQSTLLLAMRSLYATGGWNIWYLKAIAMATCVDLGLQRKITTVHGEDSKGALKRRVFWSAYALDRNIGVALGRPFCMRDESFDVEFPDEFDNDDELSLHSLGSHHSTITPSIGTARSSFSSSVYLFRLIKVISGIKSTLYRVSPESIYQGDLSEWQMIAHRQLTELREQARVALTGARRSSGSGVGHLTGGQAVELKYHEAIQLLFRPSPAFTRPSPFALQQCFTSAMESIRIYNKLKRFAELPCTRLTAYSVFLAGITMLYAYRTYREVQNTTAHEVFAEDIRLCSGLLADLAHHWPMAQKSRTTFDTLGQSTLAMSAVAASSRMLSPHDGARRLSGGSIASPRAFVDPPQTQPQSQTLEIPSATLGPSPGSLAAPQGWFPSGGMHNQVDMTWMESVNWDVPIHHQGGGQNMVGNNMEGMEATPGVDGMLASLIGEDTTMWGMDSHHAERQQSQQPR
ncbi:fungal-specific transcription factor domain-containing protein [Geopyxis carbonaria]|nr:fungal-specific transcription factor domain-containing protein [Geopyxis carbonaria]